MDASPAHDCHFFIGKMLYRELAEVS